MHSLEEANVIAKQYVCELPSLVERSLIADKDFFLSGLDQYSLTVVADEDNVVKDEPDFGTVLPLGYFNSDIFSAEDVVVHYMHVMGHKKCQAFWKQIAVPYNDFQIGEVHFLEEMYNQRLFSRVAPELHNRFYECFKRGEQFRNFVNRSLRETINTVLDKTVSLGVPDYLVRIHEKLYRFDPLLLQSFHWYVLYFHTALQYGDFRQLIEAYDMV